jgi:ABC-type multidrug transport system fused ATPase/permease subunit
VLLRFLDPEAGALLFDGNDARDHRQSDVRAMFSLAARAPTCSTRRSARTCCSPGRTPPMTS